MSKKKTKQNWKHLLNAFGWMKLRHMENHQPNLMKYLKDRNELESYILQVQEDATDYLRQATDAGEDEQVINEIIRDTWISRPDVADPKQQSLFPEEEEEE